MAFYRTTAINGVTPEPDIMFLKTASISTQNAGSLTFESLTVESDWFDTHMIVARVKSVTIENYVGGSQSDDRGGAVSYSIVNGHPTLSWTRSIYRSYEDSQGTQRVNTWSGCAADFFAVKIPEGYTP